jgi:branched-chain amino acid transport system ATP-binding protein
VNLTKKDDSLLKVDGLTKKFGGISALSDYSIEIKSGELLGLIGPNGAGKTTVFNLLSGVVKPTSGQIWFNGRQITGLRPDQNARLGIARTFQNIRLFSQLSVLDNVKAALHMRLGKGFWQTVLNLSSYRNAEYNINLRAHEFLSLLDLVRVAHEQAGNLPYGYQRRVEIARALATLPRLLLLDEPAAGMNSSETDELIRTIRRIHSAYGLAIFLVEHDMRVMMSVCPKLQVIHNGTRLAMGTPAEIQGNRRVIEAYLGKKRDIDHVVD